MGQRQEGGDSGKKRSAQGTRRKAPDGPPRANHRLFHSSSVHPPELFPKPPLSELVALDFIPSHTKTCLAPIEKIGHQRGV